jgi:hypothetical protein
MYCSTCGSAVSEKLNYCKNCGAKIAKDAEETPKSVTDNLLTTLAFVALGGFGILVGLTAVLLKNGFDQKGILLMAFFYLAALSGICFMLLRNLPKLIDARLDRPSEAPESYQPPQLYARTTAQLEDRGEPVASVTEQTTRAFDKIPLREK